MAPVAPAAISGGLPPARTSPLRKFFLIFVSIFLNFGLRFFVIVLQFWSISGANFSYLVFSYRVLGVYMIRAAQITNTLYSLTVRYELRVLVGFIELIGGSQKCTRVRPPQVSSCDLARNYNGLSALCSFEQGITMV